MRHKNMTYPKTFHPNYFWLPLPDLSLSNEFQTIARYLSHLCELCDITRGNPPKPLSLSNCYYDRYPLWSLPNELGNVFAANGTRMEKGRKRTGKPEPPSRQFLVEMVTQQEASIMWCDAFQPKSRLIAEKNARNYRFTWRHERLKWASRDVIIFGQLCRSKLQRGFPRAARLRTRLPSKNV